MSAGSLITRLRQLLRALPLPPPAAPPYDIAQWQTRPWPERLRAVCEAWAVQGYGAPLWVYAAYLCKIAFVYLGGLAVALLSSRGDIPVHDVTGWLFTEVSFQKVIVYSLLYESLGFGCGSGPLTGRYLPPFGGFLYWLRPGTIRLPLLPRMPLLRGSHRSVFDVALYAAHIVCAVFILSRPSLTAAMFLPSVVLLAVMGLRDKTLFLASRGEHYALLLVCFCFADDWLAAAMAVQFAIWVWAATSKLNKHFPAVIGVMTSNHPLLRFAALRTLMYRSFPDDLRPSKLAHALAHSGTAVEYIFPICLAFGGGGTMSLVGLGLMLAFHSYITSNFPMAVPIEWNIAVVYSGIFLFFFNPTVRFFEIESALLGAILIIALVVLPLVGNFFPRFVSFLVSMRYYAGNWAFTVWLFKGDARTKLQAVRASAPDVHTQLDMFYDPLTKQGIMSRVLAFRAMHLHGRVLHDLLPRAVPNIDDYEYIDGEIIAGWMLGWNFGDAHLHSEQLLEAVKERVQFEPGELRCIFVESQPFLRPTLAWRLVDAAQGQFAAGKTSVASLLGRHPWPEQTPEDDDGAASDMRHLEENHGSGAAIASSARRV